MSGNGAEVIAAVDLGSNSFHMKVARVVDGQLNVIDRMRDVVRLGAGLDEDDQLDEETCRRALEVLERYGQRLRNIDSHNVRVVGTNTLRRAHDADAFVAQAETALGHPIEIISGREEARLIYVGVAHSSEQEGGQRLVVDIGGGSTELIIGQHFETLRTESLYMGCVSMSREFFADGAIDGDRMRRAMLAARQELEHVEQDYRRMGWDTAIGTSGTIRSVWEVVRGEGWSRRGITEKGVERLCDRLVQAGRIDRLRLKGLQPNRAPVFPGGVAVLAAVFDALGIKRMVCSDGALREGVLFDLIGRLEHTDAREATIDDLCRRYRVDQEQALRVEASARFLYMQVVSAWDLGNDRYVYLLNWAARLHEIGLDIAHNQYHKHGAYVLRNADLPGFSRQEQSEIAALVRVHRRKFARQVFDDVPRSHRSRLIRLAVLLRLAVVFHRGRHDVDLAGLRVQAEPDSLALGFAPGWLAKHPLTEADLSREASLLKAAGLELRFA